MHIARREREWSMPERSLEIQRGLHLLERMSDFQSISLHSPGSNHCPCALGSGSSGLAWQNLLRSRKSSRASGGLLLPLLLAVL